MAHDIIRKRPDNRQAARMPDYDAVRDRFSWEDERAKIAWLTKDRMNVAHEIVDRHVAEGHGDREAIRWLGRDGTRRTLSYAELRKETDRVANLLVDLGLKPGDTVFSLLGRRLELYITAIGALKAGCVFCPLFSAFGPEPIKSRLQIGDGRLLLTTLALYRRKVTRIRMDVPSLTHVLTVDGESQDTTSFAQLLERASDRFDVRPMSPEDPALLHFTSGTTGKPKGVLHVHDAIVAHRATGRLALDLRPGDIYWCTADPGWVTGTSYGITASLANAVTLVISEAEFDTAHWYDILEEEKVAVWYTAPTAIRMLMKAGADLAKARDLSNLRFMASVGEPLNPEAVTWSNEAFGMPFHDNWWQSETGAIMIANYAAMDVKPGSMGRPVPGVVAGIVEEVDGRLVETTTPLAMGELALRPGWPSMMRAYIHEPDRYAKCFRDGWYLTGDLAMQDAEGYFWFVGRADDLIKSAGHLIGPFEVESALMEHDAVAEVAVIGMPDETAGEVVKAYVALKPDHTSGEDLALELLAHARKRLGPAVAPKSIAFRTNLPKTRSGKIMRRLLKARELGLPEGDISTLESDEV